MYSEKKSLPSPEKKGESNILWFNAILMVPVMLLCLSDFATHSGLYIEGSKAKLCLPDLLISHFFLYPCGITVTGWHRQVKRKELPRWKYGLSLLKTRSKRKVPVECSLFWTGKSICFILSSGNMLFLKLNYKFRVNRQGHRQSSRLESFR